MDAENERLIPGPLSHNDVFVHDLRLFLTAPIAVLRAIGDRVTVQPPKLLSETEMNDLVSTFDMQPEELQSIAANVLFFKQRLIGTGRDPVDAVYESRNLLGQSDLAEGREDEIADVLSYSQEERENYFAVQAFTGGPAFLGTRLLPSLLPAAYSGMGLVGAYYWTISYLSAEAEQRSITIGMTPGDLDLLEAAISQARDLLATMKSSVDSSRREEG